ncbi:hypothetical protein J3U50_07270 [Lactobacillus sp. B3795]|uniref:hypothetical protein n=1 Tax=Lactobacillus sp. B3795 TaxID=2818036 RepID=UPI00265D0DAF|nr:hypothetical protein [Lactobacillus sp. B3795]MCX8743791.1 hypothetical protein [Lactobacillus sp. B3795]
MNKKETIQSLANALINLTIKKNVNSINNSSIFKKNIKNDTNAFKYVKKIQNDIIKSTGGWNSLQKYQNDIINGSNAFEYAKKIQNDIIKSTGGWNNLQKYQSDIINGSNAFEYAKKIQNDIIKSTGGWNNLQKYQNDIINGSNAFEHAKKIQNDIIKLTGGRNNLQKYQNDIINDAGAFEYIKVIQNVTKTINKNIFLVNNDNLSKKSQEIETNSTLINKLSIQESKIVLSSELDHEDSKIIEILGENCWVLPKELINDVDFYKLILSKNNKDIDNFILNYFENNHYDMLNTYFTEIKENILKMKSQLSSEYHDFASTIINTFHKDHSSLKVLIPSLFVLLEFINSTGKKYKPFDSKTSGKAFYNDGAKENKRHVKYSMYLVGVNVYLNFDEYKKHGEKNLNRNVIQHGKANTSKLGIVDFIKLSILCNAFSFESI